MLTPPVSKESAESEQLHSIRNSQICFGPYCFDLVNRILWRGSTRIRLRPMAASVLGALVERPNELITKETLRQKVWDGTLVSPTALRVYIREIRKVLGDTIKSPRYIETAKSQGYRFIGLPSRPVIENPSIQQTVGKPAAQVTVGRDGEVARLQFWLNEAKQGNRQVVFVTGEPGIGKTTAVELFLDSLNALDSIFVGHGQCIEQYGEGEAYLPLLEAIGRLCRRPEGTQFLSLFLQYAPTWMLQLPSLLSDIDYATLQAKVTGFTQKRMLREMVEALEILTSEQTLVLVLEDLHWSDPYTLELLSYLARRTEPARLLVIGTYRPAEIFYSSHLVKAVQHELQIHGNCQELPLCLLTENDVMAYVENRSPGCLEAREVAKELYRHTDGNALFMVNFIEHLLSQGRLANTNGQWQLTEWPIPFTISTTLQQFIKKQLQYMSESDIQVLEVASVVGNEFSAAAIASGLHRSEEEIERCCRSLVRQHHFIEEKGVAEWQDGTRSSTYRFRHSVYQNVLYEQLTTSQRFEFCSQVGTHLEAVAVGGPAFTNRG